MHYYYALYRLEIDALHFNENSNREQATTKHGEKCYDIVYPKDKKGSYTVRRIQLMVQNDSYCYNYPIISFIFLGYIDDLVLETVSLCARGQTAAPLSSPGPLCADYEKTNKADAIKQHKKLHIRYKIIHVIVLSILMIAINITKLDMLLFFQF